MAHETSAAGYGYVWPRVTFASDGERIEAIGTPSPPSAAEPVRYLDRIHTTISGKDFERATDEFIQLVLARLDALGIRDTELHCLWADLSQERLDADASVQRRLEARLGFEPDEAPTDLLSRVVQLIPIAGGDAVAEIAPACAGGDSAKKLESVVAAASAEAPTGRLVSPISSLSPDTESGMPWERGWALARSARKALGLNGKPVSNKDLGELLSVSPMLFDDHNVTGWKLPLGMAVRKDGNGQAKYVFRRRHHLGRRFEAARFVADSAIAPSDDKWLPATDAKTVRQKVQRAFAAEFLCPIDALVELLEEDFSAEAISEASDYFNVGELTIRSHLANNGYIQPSEVSQDVISARMDSSD